METSKTTTKFPQTLEKGMKVTAVCMGREIGKYIVTEVEAQNAFMEVEEDPDNTRTICAVRKVGPNGLITVKHGGVNIQATDYFVKPLES